MNIVTRTVMAGLLPAVILAGCDGGAETARMPDPPALAGASTPTAPPEDPTPSSAPIPRGPSRVSVVHQGGGLWSGPLRVAGDTVPGRWSLSTSRHDVWVAIKVGVNDATSQWWGKGTTPHQMPPSLGDVLCAAGS